MAVLSDVNREVAIVYRGYKGVAIDGAKIYHPGLKRGITHGCAKPPSRYGLIGTLAAGHAAEVRAVHRLPRSRQGGTAQHPVRVDATEHHNMPLFHLVSSDTVAIHERRGSHDCRQRRQASALPSSA